MTVTEFDLDPMSHVGEPRSMLCAGSFQPVDLEKFQERKHKLVLLAFPAAPEGVVQAISHAVSAHSCMHLARGLYQLNPKAGAAESQRLALYAFSAANAARDFAGGLFKGCDLTRGVLPGLATSDGLLVGTSNAPTDLSPDGYTLLNTTKPFRDALVCQLPTLEVALVEPECAGGSTLPVEGATALSVEGWGEFCKQLDVLVFACTKTLIEALKAAAPHYPEPLEG